MREIIKIFIRQKNQRHPVSGEPLSKEKRMNGMYEIVTNRFYYKNYTKAQRVMAAEFIKQIVEEI